MYYTVCQIASMLNVNPETVRRWVRNGELDAIKTDCKKEGFLIDEKSILNFTNSHKKYKGLIDQSNQQKSDTIQRLYEIRKRVEKIEKLVSEIDDLLEDL